VGRRIDARDQFQVAHETPAAIGMHGVPTAHLDITATGATARKRGIDARPDHAGSADLPARATAV
jgi:hypothetical protein